MAGYQPDRGRVGVSPSATSAAFQDYDYAAADLGELRRQQAAFQGERNAFDQKYGWMSAPALAPEMVFAGAEVVGALAALRAARQGAPQAPKLLNFLNREPNLRNGDTYAAQLGRRAHLELKRKVDLKPGWDYEPPIRTPDGRLLKPDVRGPVRNWGPKPKQYQMEMKPDTPSGRKAAAAAVRKYEAGTENKTRAIYYDPKKYR